MSKYPVNGKVALVTGAARGIGFETAKLLVERGALVTLVDIDPVAISEAAARLGPNALGLTADVTEAASMEAVVDQTVAHFGKLDIVVANAGIAPQAATVRTMDTAVFERVLEINILGVHRTVAAALPHIVENKGHIVVTSSIYAFLNGILMAPYAMSKAAVEQYGRALRVELAPHGVSVSIAYFGFIETALTKAVLDDSIGSRLEQSFPRFLMNRLQPSVAGKVVVEGIERRAAKIIAPTRWLPLSVLRGVLNPLLDRQMAGDKKIRAILGDAEQVEEREKVSR